MNKIGVKRGCSQSKRRVRPQLRSSAFRVQPAITRDTWYDTNLNYSMDFQVCFDFVYGILFDGRISARHLPWSQVYRLAQLSLPLRGSPPQLRSSAFRVQPAITWNTWNKSPYSFYFFLVWIIGCASVFCREFFLMTASSHGKHGNHTETRKIKRIGWTGYM